MPRIDLDVPPDVVAKLALYEALYAMEPREVLAILARYHHVSTEWLDAEDVTWLVRHSKLRQFPVRGLGTDHHAAD